MKAIIIVALNFYPEPSGNAPYTTDLAQALAVDRRVLVITGFPYYPQWIKNRDVNDSSFLDSNPNMSIVRVNHYVPKKVNSVSRILMELSFGIKAILHSGTRSHTFILVTPALFSSAMYLAWLKVFRPRAKSLTWVQDLYSKGVEEAISTKKFIALLVSRLESWLLNKSNKVVFSHETFLSSRLEKLQRPENCTVIRNWSQFNYLPTKNQSEIRKDYGFGQNPVVLHIGNMGLKQGLEHLIEAAKLAEKGHREVLFVFTGAGNEQARLQRSAAFCKSIRFFGVVSDEQLSNLLSIANVLIVHEKPGVREMSIPSKLTTYFQTGNPVLVCSEPESNAALEITKLDLGYWTQSGDAQGLLQEIMFVINQGKSMKEIRAAKYALEELDKKVGTAKFLKLLSGNENKPQLGSDA